MVRVQAGTGGQRGDDINVHISSPVKHNFMGELEHKFHHAIVDRDYRIILLFRKIVLHRSLLFSCTSSTDTFVILYPL